jgi:hypothetical protein
VHDAPHRAGRVGPHRDHEAAAALRDEIVAQEGAGLGILHEVPEGGAQPLPDPTDPGAQVAELRARAVQDAAVRRDLLRHHPGLRPEARDAGADRGEARESPAGKARQGARQILRGEQHAGQVPQLDGPDPQALDRQRLEGNGGIREPAAQEPAVLPHVPPRLLDGILLLLDPLPIGARHEVPDRGGAQRRQGMARHQVQDGVELQGPPRLGVEIEERGVHRLRPRPSRRTSPPFRTAPSARGSRIRRSGSV